MKRKRYEVEDERDLDSLMGIGWPELLVILDVALLPGLLRPLPGPDYN